MIEFLTMENILAFLSLASLEIVLGIDNIVFIAILSNRLPEEIQSKARKIGLAVAMLQRILLLFVLSWVMALTEPLFEILGHEFSGRGLILLGGGLFLLAKATIEIHGTMEGSHLEEDAKKKASAGFWGVIIQIIILDVVFSLDSVITAVGMVNNIPVMIAAIIAAVLIMMVFADPISHFIMRHPTVKMLSLSFLTLIGVVLLADGWGFHINKGYIYFAMGFSIAVELLNLRLRRRQKPAKPA